MSKETSSSSPFHQTSVLPFVGDITLRTQTNTCTQACLTSINTSRFHEDEFIDFVQYMWIDHSLTSLLTDSFHIYIPQRPYKGL